METNSIDLKSKKSFIRWLLNNYQMKRRECVWILNYLLDNSSNLLEKVDFVDDYEGLDNVLIISTHCVDDKPFTFKSDGDITGNAETAFHHIRLNKQKQYYIKINARNLEKHSEYQAVVIENPNDPILSNERTEYSSRAQHVIDKAMQQFTMSQLLNKIDKALSDRDEEAFMKYSEEYKKLKSTKIF